MAATRDKATLVGHLTPAFLHDAGAINYDNSASGLTAEELQSAIDEIMAGALGSGTDNHLVRWDGTAGLQDSLVIENDTGNLGLLGVSPSVNNAIRFQGSSSTINKFIDIDAEYTGPEGNINAARFKITGSADGPGGSLSVNLSAFELESIYNQVDDTPFISLIYGLNAHSGIDPTGEIDSGFNIIGGGNFSVNNNTVSSAHVAGNVLGFGIFCSGEPTWANDGGSFDYKSLYLGAKSEIASDEAFGFKGSGGLVFGNTYLVYNGATTDTLDAVVDGVTSFKFDNNINDSVLPLRALNRDVLRYPYSV